MRIISFCLCVFVLLFSVPKVFATDSNQETAFFSALENIPLMENMSELEELNISYDTANGRILESYALANDYTQTELLQFYGQVLPQFGWMRLTESVFERGRERLSLEFESSHEDDLFLKISVQPIS